MSTGFPNFYPDFSVIFTNFGSLTTNSIHQKDDPTTGITLSDGAIDFNVAGVNKLSIDGSFRLNTPFISTAQSTFDKITVKGFRSSPVHQTTNSAALYFNQFDIPQISGSFIPLVAYTVYIDGPPNFGQTKYSLYVQTGNSYLGSIAEAKSLAIINGNYINTLTYSGNSSQTVSIPESSNSSLSLIVSSAKTGQIINAGYCSGSSVTGAILRTGTTTITNMSPSNTVHLNYFSPPGFTTNPSVASTLCISAAPSATTAHALLVLAGKTTLCGGVNSDSFNFCSEPTSGISYSSPGTFNLAVQSTNALTISSSAVTVNSALNFSTASCNFKLAASPILTIASSGLFTVANGYQGSITGSVSVRGAYGTAFSTSTITMTLYYFPLGAKTYMVLITSGLSSTFKAGASLSASNYTNGIIITFDGFPAITSAFLDGSASTGQANTSAMSTTSTDKNIILDMSSAGIAPSGNTVTVMAAQTSNVVTGNRWSSGMSLTLNLMGFVILDK